MTASAATMPPFGDGTAPSDSVEFAVYARDQVTACLHRVRVDHEGLALYTKLLQNNNLFRKLQTKDGKHWRYFRTWTDFCSTPRPYGLGRSSKDLDAIIAEAKDPRTVAEKATPLAKHGINQHTGHAGRNNVTSLKTRGNAASYRAARLARDAPEVFARLKAGEFPTVAEAERAAGMFKEESKLAVLKRTWKKTSPADRTVFLAWVATKERTV